jgi:hypothetical protein
MDRGAARVSSAERLYAVAAKHGLRVVEYPGGHYQVEGGKHVVNYWPESRRQSAYIAGKPHAMRHVSPSEVVELALGTHATQQEKPDD